MKIALAQVNPVVGAVGANARKIVDFARDARRRGADLVVFPELALTGYPPHDLLERPEFIAGTQQAIAWIAGHVPPELGVLIGAPVPNPDDIGKRLFNAAVLLDGGAIAGRIEKSLLPSYDVYDEHRFFEPARTRRCMVWRGVRLGVHVCEDMWNSDPAAPNRLYEADPLADLVDDGADLFINLSATPFSTGQSARRTAVIERICARFNRTLVMANQVGGNGELIFDGDSRVHLADGSLAISAPLFSEALVTWDADNPRASTHESETPSGVAAMRVADARNADDRDAAERDHPETDTAQLYHALVLGIRDYVRKSETLSSVLIGVSGGIDSTVTAALAVAALGADNVAGVTMPSRYTPPSSLEDARDIARNLGIELHELPIGRALDAVLETVGPLDEGAGVVEENIQARIRAVIQMALSNRSGSLVLSTSNKSEAAMGYTTLYGDMTGGLGVLSDVYKSHVYDLARYINGHWANGPIPERVLRKPPSAELRPGQTDQDALPPYDVLDEILRLRLDERLHPDAIVGRSGYGRELVHDVLRRLDAAEFKRRQAPPGLRVSRSAFVTGHRLPLLAKWNPEGIPDL